MIKQFLLSLSLLVSVACLAQEADSINLDSEIRKDPAGLAIQFIKLNKLRLSENSGSFAGIRFTDARADTTAVGFVQLWGENKKIVVDGGFANSLNANISFKKNTEQGDSLIIYIKHFWETRIPLMQTEVEEETRYDPGKPISSRQYSFCHVTAAFFIKNSKGMAYCGKFDSLVTSSRKLISSYSTLPDKAIGILLNQMPVSIKEDARYFTEDQVFISLTKPIVFPEASVMPDGIFLSYEDFKKGKIIKKSFSVSPRIYGYKLDFENSVDEAAFTDNFWGVCYKNQFYIRRSYVVNMLWKSGSTYTSLAGSIPSRNGRSPNNKIYRFVFGTDVMNMDAKRDINKFTKEKTNFFPMLLNPLTGYLE